VESKTITLTEGGSAGMSLENVFYSDAYRFQVQVTDAPPLVVDTATVRVRLDGELIRAAVSKTAGVTTISGTYPSLLAPNSSTSSRWR